MEESNTKDFLTIQEIKLKWNELAKIYKNFDNSMNTFFYQLVHMLRLTEAHNIYEVGCGTGRLLPYVMSIKSKEASYLAIDLSEAMVELAK